MTLPMHARSAIAAARHTQQLEALICRYGLYVNKEIYLQICQKTQDLLVYALYNALASSSCTSLLVLIICSPTTHLISPCPKK